MKYIITENNIREIIKKKLGRIDIFVARSGSEVVEIGKLLGSRFLSKSEPSLWNQYIEYNEGNPFYIIKKDEKVFISQLQKNTGHMISDDRERIYSVSKLMDELGLENFGWDFDTFINIYFSLKKKDSENITESEDSRANKLTKVVYKKGVFDAVKLVGDYQTLLNMILPNEIPIEMKGEAIVDYLDRDSDGYGVGFSEIGIDPILWKETRDEIHQIEYLGRSGVIVQVWGGYNYDTDIGEYGIPYEALPHKILDEILITITS